MYRMEANNSLTPDLVAVTAGNMLIGFRGRYVDAIYRFDADRTHYGCTTSCRKIQVEVMQTKV